MITTLFRKVKKFVNLVAGFVPTALPVGVPAFNKWADSIIETYNFPNNDSIRFALATMIMHMGPTSAYKSKFFFFLMVRAAMAKQVAGAMFTEFKQKQAEAAKTPQS